MTFLITKANCNSFIGQVIQIQKDDTSPEMNPDTGARNTDKTNLMLCKKWLWSTFPEPMLWIHLNFHFSSVFVYFLSLLLWCLCCIAVYLGISPTPVDQSKVSSVSTHAARGQTQCLIHHNKIVQHSSSNTLKGSQEKSWGCEMRSWKNIQHFCNTARVCS